MSEAASSDDRTMAMIGHLSGIVAGFIGPLIIWLINKEKADKTWLNDQAKEALNFQITLLIAYFVSGILTLVLIGIFILYPILSVVYYSFTDYTIATPPEWTGLDNYRKLVGDPTFWLAFSHSIVYLLVTPILIVLSIGLAIIVNRRLRGIHVFRALYYVPAVAGTIAIVSPDLSGVPFPSRKRMSSSFRKSRT